MDESAWTYTYEDLMVEKMLKESIIGRRNCRHLTRHGSDLSTEQAKVMYNAQYPLDRIWSVVVDRGLQGSMLLYSAYVVVYEDTRSRSCYSVVLKTREDEDYRSPKAALEQLLDKSRMKVLHDPRLYE